MGAVFTAKSPAMIRVTRAYAQLTAGRTSDLRGWSGSLYVCAMRARESLPCAEALAQWLHDGRRRCRPWVTRTHRATGTVVSRHFPSGISMGTTDTPGAHASSRLGCRRYSLRLSYRPCRPGWPGSVRDRIRGMGIGERAAAQAQPLFHE
jgi:hypothetical protein